MFIRFMFEKCLQEHTSRGKLPCWRGLRFAPLDKAHQASTTIVFSSEFDKSIIPHPCVRGWHILSKFRSSFRSSPTSSSLLLPYNCGRARDVRVVPAIFLPNKITAPPCSLCRRPTLRCRRKPAFPLSQINYTFFLLPCNGGRHRNDRAIPFFSLPQIITDPFLYGGGRPRDGHVVTDSLLPQIIKRFSFPYNGGRPCDARLVPASFRHY